MVPDDEYVGLEPLRRSGVGPVRCPQPSGHHMVHCRLKVFPALALITSAACSEGWKTIIELYTTNP